MIYGAACARACDSYEIDIFNMPRGYMYKPKQKKKNFTLFPGNFQRSIVRG